MKLFPRVPLNTFRGWVRLFRVALLLLMLLVLAARGQFKSPKSSGVEAVGIYWHFVDAVWIVVYSVIYLWSVFG